MFNETFQVHSVRKVWRQLQREGFDIARLALLSRSQRSVRYSERLAEAGMEPSVRTVGDHYDNALTELNNGFYKASYGPITQTKRSPAKPARFIP